MTAGGLATRYARALFELGLEQGDYQSVLSDLSTFVQAWNESTDLRHVLLTPSILIEARKDVVRSLQKPLSLSTLVTHFILLLLDKDRIEFIGEITEAFQSLADDKDNVTRAQVTSARPLTDAHLNRIQNALAKLTGKSVVVNTDIQPEIIGGVITRIGGKVYDGSIRSQLQRLRQQAASEL